MNPLATVIVGAVLWSTAIGATAASRSPGRPGAEADAPLRDPLAVHNRLREICSDAGYPPTRFDQCARAISRRCAAARIDPASARCWQWLVDRDTGGELDRRRLGAAGTTAPARPRP